VREEKQSALTSFSLMTQRHIHSANSQPGLRFQGPPVDCYHLSAGNFNGQWKQLVGFCAEAA